MAPAHDERRSPNPPRQARRGWVSHIGSRCLESNPGSWSRQRLRLPESFRSFRRQILSASPESFPLLRRMRVIRPQAGGATVPALLDGLGGRRPPGYGSHRTIGTSCGPIPASRSLNETAQLPLLRGVPRHDLLGCGPRFLNRRRCTRPTPARTVLSPGILTVPEDEIPGTDVVCPIAVRKIRYQNRAIVERSSLFG
jgi:hypothetical protein